MVVETYAAMRHEDQAEFFYQIDEETRQLLLEQYYDPMDEQTISVGGQ